MKEYIKLSVIISIILTIATTVEASKKGENYPNLDNEEQGTSYTLGQTPPTIAEENENQGQLSNEAQLAKLNEEIKEIWSRIGQFERMGAEGDVSYYMTELHKKDSEKYKLLKKWV